MCWRQRKIELIHILTAIVRNKHSTKKKIKGKRAPSTVTCSLVFFFLRKMPFESIAQSTDWDFVNNIVNVASFDTGWNDRKNSCLLCTIPCNKSKILNTKSVSSCLPLLCTLFFFCCYSRFRVDRECIQQSQKKDKEIQVKESNEWNKIYYFLSITLKLENILAGSIILHDCLCIFACHLTPETVTHRKLLYIIKAILSDMFCERSTSELRFTCRFDWFTQIQKFNTAAPAPAITKFLPAFRDWNVELLHFQR